MLVFQRIRDLFQHFIAVFSFVRLLTGVDLKQHDSKGINICCDRIHSFASQQFRCHPERSASCPKTPLLRKAKIGNLCAEALPIDENVLSLEVAMDDVWSGSVEEAHSQRNVVEDCMDVVTLQQKRIVVDDIVQGAVVHVLHHEQGIFGIQNGAHDGRDVGMSQLGQMAHLSDKIGLQPAQRSLCEESTQEWHSLTASSAPRYRLSNLNVDLVRVICGALRVPMFDGIHVDVVRTSIIDLHDLPSSRRRCPLGR
mmetsp:Transcript_28762/g.81108  ORF Transcript_28762/g.81108 Transcript_28762/m.81108 type:complete len:254 (-) Transcript_28762:3827-4588(-)